MLLSVKMQQDFSLQFSCIVLLNISYHKNRSGDLAERGAEGPTVGLGSLHGPHGQSHQQQHIRQSQVKNEGISHTPGPPALTQNPQQQSIPQDPHNKCQRVQNHDECGLEFLAVCQVTHFTHGATVLISRAVVREVLECIQKLRELFSTQLLNVPHQ